LSQSSAKGSKMLAIIKDKIFLNLIRLRLMGFTTKIYSAVLLISLAEVAMGQQTPYHPLRISNNLILDGKLIEPEWKNAEMETDFMQYDPSAGAKPTHVTEIRILYNNDYLFVGLRAYDPHPDSIIGYALQRDFQTGNDDGFAFVIDMYDDKSTGLAFISNTLNARWDAEVSADGVNLNDSYNTFWDVSTHIDSLGYTTEFRIPFSSLRFEAKDKVTMGFRIIRLIKRRNEYDIFPRCDPKIQDAYMKVSLAREMEFDHLKNRRPFYVIPYITANYTEEKALNSLRSAYDKNSEFLPRKNFVQNKSLDKLVSNIGLDIKYGLSKNLTLDATINTDFAQAEADNVIVNLTKYEVNLAEKRNFFLESQNYFNYSTTTGNQLFISRSIGLENDVIVPIIAGARITGKAHRWQMGLLDMQTKEMEDQLINGHNIFVFRTRREIDSIGSFVGGSITNRLNTTGNHLSSQSFGLDVVKKINDQVIAQLSVAGTTNNIGFRKMQQCIEYNAGIFRTAKQGWYYGTDFDYVGKNFLPALGYVQENDLFYVGADVGYRWKLKEESKSAYYFLHTNLRYKRKPVLNKEETRFTNAEAGVEFKNGAIIKLTPIEYSTDILFENWQLTDHITIPVGNYRIFSPDLEVTSPQKSNYYGELFLKFLDFYAGQRITIRPNFTYIVNKHFTTRFEYEYDRIKFPNGFSDNGDAVFLSNLIRLDLSYYLSSRLSIKLLSQYDQISNLIGTNLRFRYNPREGTDLYIVFNHGMNCNVSRLTPKLPVMNNEAVIVKFVKTFIQ
jgi:hypothetical protein